MVFGSRHFRNNSQQFYAGFGIEDFPNTEVLSLPEGGSQNVAPSVLCRVFIVLLVGPRSHRSPAVGAEN